MKPDERKEARCVLCEAIVASVPDPAGWMLALRRVVEALGMRPEMCIPLGDVTLANACAAIVMYGGNDLTLQAVRDAVKVLQ